MKIKPQVAKTTPRVALGHTPTQDGTGRERDSHLRAKKRLDVVSSGIRLAADVGIIVRERAPHDWCCCGEIQMLMNAREMAEAEYGISANH